MPVCAPRARAGREKRGEARRCPSRGPSLRGSEVGALATKQQSPNLLNGRLRCRLRGRQAALAGARELPRGRQEARALQLLLEVRVLLLALGVQHRDAGALGQACAHQAVVVRLVGIRGSSPAGSIGGCQRARGAGMALKPSARLSGLLQRATGAAGPRRRGAHEQELGRLPPLAGQGEGLTGSSPSRRHNGQRLELGFACKQALQPTCVAGLGAAGAGRVAVAGPVRGEDPEAARRRRRRLFQDLTDRARQLSLSRQGRAVQHEQH
mmetsp:Transcript_82838/g.237992  ORF Transcript_82838/g.237992 Transcript_82838/m.237992 type:complete len:267 (+) Transcript_82838:58-858(+)